MGGQQKLLARLGNEAADAIAEFLSLTLTHEESHAPSLEGFLDWVSRGEAEIKRDMERGRDEVRVMTVHGAKGLEADIVILPDTTSQPGGHGRHDGLLFTDAGALFPLPQKQASQALRDAKAAADAEALKEHRRLLYVGLTRARDRLYVCGFAGSRGPHADSWYALTEAAATSMGVAVTQGDGQIHTYGTLEMETGERVTSRGTIDALPAWMTAPAPDEPARPRLIRPSDAVDTTQVFSPLASGTQRFARGLLVHALLARLPETDAARRLPVAQAFARAHGFDEAEAQALAAETMAVLEHPDFAAAFGQGSRAEAGFVAELPELGERARVNGRVDRLAVTDTQVLILDFKTNRPAPRSESQVAPVYLGQMALYRAAAAKVFPGRRIVCGLLFTDGPRLMRLSDAILDQQWADLTAKFN
jgi:ATP-dependent helicase/nuclease subunit A